MTKNFKILIVCITIESQYEVNYWMLFNYLSTFKMYMLMLIVLLRFKYIEMS